MRLLKALHANFNILALEANVVVPNIRADPFNASLAEPTVQHTMRKVSLLNNILPLKSMPVDVKLIY